MGRPIPATHGCGEYLPQVEGNRLRRGNCVPLIVKWPGLTKPGTVTDVPASRVDLFPMFLEIAGARSAPKSALNVESLVRLLQ